MGDDSHSWEPVWVMTHTVGNLEPLYSLLAAQVFGESPLQGPWLV